MSRIRTAFVVSLLVLQAVAVLAQPGIAPPLPDRLGLYTTEHCTSDNAYESGPGLFTVYGVLTGTSAAYVRSIECHVRLEPPAAVPWINWDFMGANWISFAPYPNFLVSWDPYYPGAQQEILLFSLTYFVSDATPVYFYLEPIQSQPPHFPGEMAYHMESGYSYVMHPVSEDHALPVFGLNTGVGWWQPGTITVDVQPGSFSAPWELTGPWGGQSGFGDEVLNAMPHGDYTIEWLPYDSWVPPDPSLVAFTLDPFGTALVEGYYEPVPAITSVVDVPDDQGGQVRLTWNRSPYDWLGAEYPITGYGVYRRQDDKLLGWDFLETVPARGDEAYQYVAATLCDSTVAHGSCETVLMVSAMTADPLTFWDSAPDSGWSVDNLAPGAPADLRAAFDGARVLLDWDAPLDPDLDHFLVFRIGDATPPDPADPPLEMVYDTGYIDDGGGWGYAYWVAAVDRAGNRSDLTAWSDADLTGIGDGAAPGRVVLHAAAPNPFNPATTIAFELPRRTAVTLAVHDMSGRMVRTLLDGEVLGEGRREAVWDGRDAAGRPAASGAYVYILEADGGRQARRMVLLK